MAKGKLVFFGKNDDELLRYADSLDNFSQWVKERLRQEMGQKDRGADIAEIEALVDRLIDIKLQGKLIDAKPHADQKQNDDISSDIDKFF